MHTTSLIEPIDPNIQLQEQAPFLLYRSQKNQIFGFWFYSKDDCKRIHNLLLNIAKKSKLPVKGEVQPQSEAKKDDVDIFSMLSMAQKNFMTSSSPNPQTAQPPKPQQQQPVFIAAPPQAVQPPMQNHGRPVIMQNAVNNAGAPNDITVPTVANFFAAAQKPMKSNPPNNHRQAPHPQQNPKQAVPVNSCPTVDEIEKLFSCMNQASVSPKQNVATPQVPAVNSNPILSKFPVKCYPKKNLKQLHQLSVKQQSRPEPIVNNKPKEGPTLVTPIMLLKSSEAKPSANHIQKPLDSQQLLQALKYLLENDPEFVRKIHETYVNNFQNNSHHWDFCICDEKRQKTAELLITYLKRFTADDFSDIDHF